MLENEYRVVGPPGTGKSTYLVDQTFRRVDAWCERTGYHSGVCSDVLISSMTRAAAAEIHNRGLKIPEEQISTLHSHCMRALGRPKLCVDGKAIKQWNADSPAEFWLSGAEMKDDEKQLRLSDYRGDDLHFEYTVNRCRLTPREEWREEVVEFATAFESWKYKNTLLDFQDLISKAYEDNVDPPGNPSTILIDECQDHSKAEMRLLRRWATKVDKLIIVGDSDQCQPAGTMVDISGGSSLPIESLNPEIHRIVTYGRHESKILGVREGRNFSIASRLYTGWMYDISVGGASTKCTINHDWIAKWKKSQDDYVVYLMRRGDRWRVGHCKLWINHKSGGLHFNIRCRLEGADGGWILKTFKDRKSAAAYEQVVAIKFGMPMPCFSDDAVFDSLDPRNQALRAAICLSDHGRDPSFPFYDLRLRNEKKGARTPLVVKTCNLLPDLMLIPRRADNRKVDWFDFTISRKLEKNGVEVFSLNVDVDHNYIANGIVTHNCIFGWRGADPNAFYDGEIPDGHTKVLEQSYRVPREVHAASMEMISRVNERVPVVYHPRDDDGRVSEAYFSMRNSPYDLVKEIERHLEEPNEGKNRAKVMCLFSCAYMAQPLMAALKKAGIPFWNPYAMDRNNFNPLHASKGVTTLDRVLNFLRPNQHCYGINAKTWTWGEFNSWLELCGVDSWLKRGSKAEVKRRASVFPNQEMTIEEILVLLESQDVLDELADCELSFLMKHALDQKVNTLGYCVDIVNKLGYSGVTEKPRTIVGTVHSVKGGEAEIVYLCPDLSVAGFDCYGNSFERDALHRLYYVGMTRARHHLRLTQRSSDKAIRW